jgi:hypothetical protein
MKKKKLSGIAKQLFLLVYLRAFAMRAKFIIHNVR